MRGRFAPSPTGALHLGNAFTAYVAWRLATRGGGEFFVGIRAALVDGATARVFAGAGIVAG